MTLDITTLTLSEIGLRLRNGSLTSREVTEFCLNRIYSLQSTLNAFILVLPEEARRQALVADREILSGIDRGPLHGVPVSVKDLIDVRATVTTAASSALQPQVAECDAKVVQHVRHAGAVLVGKTNLHEFGFGTTNEDSAFGPALNPYDLRRTPGGSSGGAAISVATGMAFGAIATDTGGSIRIPAAACGVVGLKPSYGEISVDGVIPLSRNLDHVGVLTRCVGDVYLLYKALLGDITSAFPTPLKGRRPRLAILRSYFCEVLDDEVCRRFDESLAQLHAAGFLLDDAIIPHALDIPDTFMRIQGGDAGAYHADLIQRSPELYTRPVRARIEAARRVLASDYVRALEFQALLRQEVDEALEDHDAIVLPTMAIPAPLLGTETVETNRGPQALRPLMLRNTQLFNVTGHPAVSIPCGRTADGMPCGFQLVGRTMHTEALLQMAAACESWIVSPSQVELASQTPLKET